MIDKNDWRLTGQEKYLKGVTLYWKKYSQYSESWDHDHCAFCWAEFAVDDYPDVLHEGYSTKDDYYWICKNCFEDFKDMFDWKLEKEQ
jgi:hypothetical protein